MNKIEKLLEEFCPQGVEFRALGEVADYVRGLTYSKKDEVQSGEGLKVLRSNNISISTNTLNFDDVKIVSTKVKIRENQHLIQDDILISAASGSKAHVGKVAYISKNLDYCFGGFMAVIRTNTVISSRFLFHLLVGENFSKYLEKSLSTTTINNLSASIMNAFQIPIPPLTIQKEIVKILDNFTQSETELEVKLEAELEARKKQYEYYRGQLLMVNDKGLMVDGTKVEFRALGEVADYSRTRISATELNDEKHVGVDNLLQNKQGKTVSNYVPITGNLTRYESGDILIGNIRPYLKKIWLAVNVGGANGDVLVIQINQNKKSDLSSKYLYYLLASDNFFSYNMQFAKGAKMPRGDKSAIMKFKISIPPLAKQQEIVTILDKFDALVNDISTRLPAEIVARKKQYEYYRNQLLNFKPLDAQNAN